MGTKFMILNTCTYMNFIFQLILFDQQRTDKILRYIVEEILGAIIVIDNLLILFSISQLYSIGVSFNSAEARWHFIFYKTAKSYVEDFQKPSFNSDYY